MIKKTLRRVLPERTYRMLSQLKHGVVLFPARGLAGLIRAVPGRFPVTVKEDLDIVKKLDYGGCDIYLNIQSSIEYNTRLHSCDKEPETVGWIETFFQEGDTLYDIGSNVGVYSLVASKFYSGRLTVFAFEPAFPNFVQLCKNVLLNSCQGSIVPLQIGLSDKTRMDVFNYDNLVPGGALHALGDPIDYKGERFDPVFTVRVLAYRMDDLIQEFDLPVPSGIKLDVDGIELAVLRGAKQTLSNPLVKTIILEVDEEDDEADEIVGFLADRGLEFQAKHKCLVDVVTGPLSTVYNYIFHRPATCTCPSCESHRG